MKKIYILIALTRPVFCPKLRQVLRFKTGKYPSCKYCRRLQRSTGKLYETVKDG